MSASRAGFFQRGGGPDEAEEDEEEAVAAGERAPLMQQHYEGQQQALLGPGSPQSVLLSAMNTPRPSQQSGHGGRPRMGRRFTLNPLIFAKVSVLKLFEPMGADGVNGKRAWLNAFYSFWTWLLITS